jgi:hypothetical protein
MRSAIFSPLISQAEIDAEIRRRLIRQRVGDFVSGVAFVVIFFGAPVYFGIGTGAW